MIANTGVGDLDAIIDLARNGSVIVKDFRPETLRPALETILSLPANHREKIRSQSSGFSLDEAHRRYASVYAALQSDIDVPKAA